ncbi:hypothetical protein V1477_007801 [Vespula maculifrons]|uniref:Uncharacterized protein n=1 Tax=Vespula maculifrons TaxID=7453 RepID=A0ABD2CFU9_VESMC
MYKECDGMTTTTAMFRYNYTVSQSWKLIVGPFGQYGPCVNQNSSRKMTDPSPLISTRSEAVRIPVRAE